MDRRPPLRLRGAVTPVRKSNWAAASRTRTLTLMGDKLWRSCENVHKNNHRRVLCPRGFSTKNQSADVASQTIHGKPTSMKTKKRILVMGAAGFTGRALCDHLEKTSGENVQVVRASISARGDHRIVEYDGRSSAEVKHLFASVQPHQIYHLVGSYTGEYDTDYMSNVLCAKNVLDAVLTQRKEHPRVLVVGSAAAVGLVKRGDLPVKESVALSPVTMYGLTKAAQALLATSYFRMYQADVVVARMFNIIG